ncbi:hypothetical protein [Bradyrhizobium sp. SZCCHNR1039]|uniref:hypothetical protein n=1 Tax=Bradyrhizobium sp. SZCCHNR1039 TaxID=3057350 RepID=UPI00291647C8|nr:hypothetical protein [Bradyrhizobium sp. SZCCHNR1039]
MSQKTEKSKSNPEFESPDGVRIQINRGGNKMQFVRDLCRNKKITPIQFRILVPLVDTSNEGTDDDRSRWGKSWLSLENLAKESGCSKRAVEKNLPKLEAADIVKVWRDLDDDGRPTGGKSNVNEYWLYGWNKFGAVVEDGNSERRSPFEDGNSERGTSKQRTADQQTANAGPGNSEQRSPDSTYRPYSKTQPKDPTQAAPASGERGPAGGLNDQDQTSNHPSANDNDTPEEAHIRKCFNDFWALYPRKIGKDEAFREFRKIAMSGEVSSAEIMRGLSMYRKSIERSEPRFVLGPARWLRERRWGEFSAMPSQTLRSRMNVII